MEIGEVPLIPFRLLQSIKLTIKKLYLDTVITECGEETPALIEIIHQGCLVWIGRCHSLDVRDTCYFEGIGISRSILLFSAHINERGQLDTVELRKTNIFEQVRLHGIDRIDRKLLLLQSDLRPEDRFVATTDGISVEGSNC